MTSKRCTKCFKIKSVSHFSKQPNGLYGRRADCKKCQVVANRELRRLHRVTRQDNKCWSCGQELSPQRFRSECKRIAKEGPGAKLPRCVDCQIQGK